MAQLGRREKSRPLSGAAEIASFAQRPTPTSPVTLAAFAALEEPSPINLALFLKAPPHGQSTESRPQPTGQEEVVALARISPLAQTAKASLAGLSDLAQASEEAALAFAQTSGRVQRRAAKEVLLSLSILSTASLRQLSPESRSLSTAAAAQGGEVASAREVEREEGPLRFSSTAGLEI